METSEIKIALADDHTILRKGVIELVNSFEDCIVIIEATNGKDLITKIEAAPVLPDVCIIDINMPEQNGYETAVIIKQRWSSIKILALSMYNNEYSIIKMLRNGAHGYILKDADPSELNIAIQSVHKQSFYHSELITGRILSRSKTKDDVLGITEREWEFLSLCSTDLSYKDIAEKMKLSPRTVEGYRDSLFRKLDIKSRSGLVVFANNIGLND